MVFQRYGDVGIVVARLMGNTRRIKPEEIGLGGTIAKMKYKILVPVGEKAIAEGFDTLIGNKSRAVDRNLDEIVLLRSAQCLPLIQYPASLANTSSGDSSIPTALQPWVDAMHRVIGDFFNEASEKRPRKPVVLNLRKRAAPAATRAAISPPKKKSKRSSSKVSSTTSAKQNAPNAKVASAGTSGPNALPKQKVHNSNATNPTRPSDPVATALISIDEITYQAPETLSNTNLVEDHNSTDDLEGKICTICQYGLSQTSDVMKVKRCQHSFCRECILRHLHNSRKCPSCQVPIGEPQGKSPSGTLTIVVDPTRSCEGHSDVGRIQITYNIFGGNQKGYHEIEGKPFKGIKRVAFLPDNDDGRRLLKRLKYAFSHGLTFSIGESLTSGKKGVVTWASIHHKTSPKQGTYGWPDLGYFVRCNQELDTLGVPSARDCS